MQRRFEVVVVLVVVAALSWVLPVRAESITIYVNDAAWHTGRVYDDLSCVDGDIHLSDQGPGVAGEVGGWARFDTSEIPNEATITEVRLYFYIDLIDAIGPYVDFHALASDPQDVSCAQRWVDINDGTAYVSQEHLGSTGWWYVILGTQAAADLQAQLDEDWFGVGFEHNDGASFWAYIAGHNSSHRPYLRISYAMPSSPEPDLVSVSGIPTTIPLGDSFTVQVTGENDGGLSEEALINASVRYSDGSDDVILDNVSASWADLPVRNHAPGEGPLYTRSCVPLPGGAADAVIEAVDTHWALNDRHTLSFRVSPQKAGQLWVRTRATMAEEKICVYANDHSVSGGVVETDQQGWEVVRFVVTVDAPPVLTLTQPASNLTVDPGDIITIQWTDSDPDDNAVIGLAYDLDDDPTNGSGHVWITQSLSENPDGSSDQYAWDTATVAPGSYTLWGRISDGVNDARYSLAPGHVTVQDSTIFPSLSYDGHTLDDEEGNGDGIANCGETLGLYVTLENHGSGAAEGVHATISTADPYVTWLSNTASSYPDIPVGARRTNSNDFDLALAPDTPNGHQVHLDLAITAINGGPWSDDFQMAVTCTPNSPPYKPGTPSPSDGAMNQDRNVDLHWSGGDPDAGDTVRYDVFLEAGDSTPDVRVCNDITTTTCDPGLLAQGAHYSWKVIAVDNHGATATSAVWDFETACPLPSISSLLIPGEGAESCNAQPAFGWSPVSDATSYILEVDDAEDFANPKVTATPSSTIYTPTYPLMPGSYVWRVRAVNGCGEGSWSAVRHFTVLSRPGAPNLETPPEGNTTCDGQPAFGWSHVSSATSYVLEVDNVENFVQPEVVATSSGTIYTPTAPLAPGSYVWRVQAVNGCGGGSWSAVWRFTVRTAPSAPQLSSPQQAAVLSDTTPTFTWTPLSEATSYCLQVDTQGDFFLPKLQVIPTENCYTPEPVDALARDATYHWRVRGFNVCGPGPWSAIRWFTLLPMVPGVDSYGLYLPLILR